MAGWYSGLGATVVAVAVIIGLRTLRQRFAVVTVTGQSMQPTLIAGDRVLVRRRDIRELQSGQIVVFRRPASDSTWQTEPPRSADGGAGWAIKRLAAIPGDRLPAEILATADCNPELLVPGLVVPCQKLFVIGDNVDGSFDSRHFGYVPAEHLLGVVHSRLRLRPWHVLHRNPIILQNG